MMGLEPTTFCMAKGTDDLTPPDATDGIRMVRRNRREPAMHSQSMSSHRT